MYRKWVFIIILFFSSSSLVFAAQPASNTQQACTNALNKCRTEASKLYPYDGGIINSIKPSQNHQAYLGAQKICDYLYAQCVAGKPINPFTVMNGFDQAAMDALTAVFNAHLTGQGTGGIGVTYSTCMENVGDTAYCEALFPATVRGNFFQNVQPKRIKLQTIPFNTRKLRPC